MIIKESVGTNVFIMIDPIPVKQDMISLTVGTQRQTTMARKNPNNNRSWQII